MLTAFLFVILQIVGESDMVYGVAHSHRVSRVYAIQRQDALQFVQVRQYTGQQIWIKLRPGVCSTTNKQKTGVISQAQTTAKPTYQSAKEG